MSENILAPDIIDMPWNDVVNHVKSFLSSHAKFGCSLSYPVKVPKFGALVCHHPWGFGGIIDGLYYTKFDPSWSNQMSKSLAGALEARPLATWASMPNSIRECNIR